MDAHEIHLRIGRLTVTAAAGADRSALARELAAKLPAVIAQRLQPGGTPVGADPSALDERIAAAVAPRVAAQLEARR